MTSLLCEVIYELHHTSLLPQLISAETVFLRVNGQLHLVKLVKLHGCLRVGRVRTNFG